MSLLFNEPSIKAYKSIMENNPDAVFILSPDGIILETNAKVSLIFGYSKEELEGIHYQDIVVPEYVECTNQQFTKVLQGVYCEYETQAMHKNGQTILLQVTNIPLMANSELVGVFGIAKNITERKKAEEALVESEKHYRRLVELAPIAMIVHREGFIQYANPTCVKLLGASSIDELLRKTILEFSPQEYRGMVENRIQELDRAGISIEPTKEKVICIDGKIIDVTVTGISINYDGKPSYLMMFQDTTKERQTQETLRKSEEKYRLLAENMTDLIGILDVNGVVLYASPSHEHVLGFAPEVYEGHLAFDMVHADDILHVQSKFMEMMMTKENKVIEFRYKHIKSYWVWVEAKGTPVLDEDGNILHFQVVARDITERKVYEEKLAHLAFHDALTGKPNRRLFKERFKQAIKEAGRYGRKMAVMYMDMDKFKSINDSLGHDVGDELLKQFARRVQECLRESDILARQGGDEFIVLLPEIEMEQDAAEVAHRILASIQKPWEIRGHVFETTSSIGIAFYPRDGTTRHELLEHADEALYHAKENGRNTVETYYGSDGREH